MPNLPDSTPPGGQPRAATPPDAARSDFTLRPAEPRDVARLVQLIHDLAAFEQLSHMVRATPESLHPHLFGPRPVVEALVAEVPAPEEPARVVAFALFLTNFSTFLSRPGLYLEDLFVEPAYRGAGIGEALLKRLAQLAVERGCGRFEWTVLDWNTDAIGFYERMGASLLPEWRICRVTGEALERLGTA